MEPQAATVLPDEGELPENRSDFTGRLAETLRLGSSLFSVVLKQGIIQRPSLGGKRFFRKASSRRLPDSV